MDNYWPLIALAIVFVVVFVSIGIISIYVDRHVDLQRHQRRLYLRAILEERLKKEKDDDS